MSHDIGWAVKQMWDGNRVRRIAWPKDVWLACVKPVPIDRESTNQSFEYLVTTTHPIESASQMRYWIGLHDKEGWFGPWAPTHTDLLGIGWELAEEEPG